MTNPSETRVKKIMEDIAAIKEVLAKSRPSFRFLLHPVHFRTMSLPFGLSVFLIAGIYHWLIYSYGSYGAVPGTCRHLMLGVILADWVFLGTFKIARFSRSVTSSDPAYSYRRAVLEMLTFRFVHFYLVFFFSVLFFVAYFIITGTPYLVIPTLAIGIGILFNYLGNISELSEYIITGSWMIAAAAVVIAAGTIPATLAVMLIFGVCFIYFWLHAWVKYGNRGI